MMAVLESYHRRKQLVNKATFIDFATNNPEILSPVERLQENLIETSLGKNFWRAITIRRQQLTLDGYDFTLEDILNDPEGIAKIVKDPVRSSGVNVYHKNGGGGGGGGGAVGVNGRRMSRGGAGGTGGTGNGGVVSKAVADAIHEGMHSL
jgi:hypothetical protein